MTNKTILIEENKKSLRTNFAASFDLCNEDDAKEVVKFLRTCPGKINSWAYSLADIIENKEWKKI